MCYTNDQVILEQLKPVLPFADNFDQIVWEQLKPVLPFVFMVCLGYSG